MGSVVGSRIAKSRLHTDAAIGHSSGVACAVLSSVAVHGESVAIRTNVVCLHLQLEASGIVICADLVEVKKHAGLIEITHVFGVVAKGRLGLL